MEAATPLAQKEWKQPHAAEIIKVSVRGSGTGDGRGGKIEELGRLKADKVKEQARAGINPQ